MAGDGFGPPIPIRQGAGGDGFGSPVPVPAKETPSFSNWLERGVAPNEAVPWYDPIVRAANQVVTWGAGDEIAAGSVAAGKAFRDRLPVSMGGAPTGQERDFLPLYREQRGQVRGADARAAAERPWLYTGGTTLASLAMIPFAKASSGGTLTALAAPESSALMQYLQAIKGGAKAGIGIGSVAGLGSTEADLTRPGVWGPEAKQALADVGRSGLEGGLFGATIPASLGALGWAEQNVVSPAMSMVRGGYVTPTPEARRLMSRGVDMTLGRMDPNSSVGRLEELASAKAHGGGISEMRSATDRDVRRVLIRDAGAPGEAPPSTSGTISEQVGQVRQSYHAAYDKALEGVKVDPSQYQGKGAWRGVVTDESVKGAARRQGAFEMAAADTSIDATKPDRARALKWLKDQATVLNPDETGMVAATNLQSLRTNIGKEISALEGSDAPGARARLGIYKKAWSFVNEVLHEGLPSDASARLKAVDSHYANKLALEEAFGKAFKSGTDVGGGEFTAEQLLNAVGKIGSTPQYEQTARDAHNVLTAKYSKTGIQGSALDMLPGSKYIAQPLAQLLNTSPSLRHHALNPAFGPGLPSRAASLATRAAEGIGMTPSATGLTYKTLYDLLRRQEADAPLSAAP